MNFKLETNLKFNRRIEIFATSFMHEYSKKSAIEYQILAAFNLKELSTELRIIIEPKV